MTIRSMSFFGNDINALSLMLNESRQALDSVSTNQSQQPHMSLEPSRVVLGGAQTVNSSSSSNCGKIKKSVEKDIWQDNEIPSEDSIMRMADDRPSPQYEFSYKQEMGTQDTFLGLNGKSPSSSDCSHLVCNSCLDMIVIVLCNSRHQCMSNYMFVIHQSSCLLGHKDSLSWF